MLHFRHFGIGKVNSAQNSVLVHSDIEKRAKFDAKIFTHFCDTVIFMLRYFILKQPVHVARRSGADKS